MANGNDTLYETLGVTPDASSGEINTAYRLMARRHHPDANGTGDSTQFKQITRAYEVLRDDEKRRRYDETGDTGEKRPQCGSLTLVVMCMHESLIELISNGRNPEQIDILKLTADKLAAIRKKLIKSAKDSRLKANQFRAVAARLETSHDENALRESLIGPATALESDAAESERKIVAVDLADEILSHYKYRADKSTESTWPPPVTRGVWYEIKLT